MYPPILDDHPEDTRRGGARNLRPTPNALLDKMIAEKLLRTVSMDSFRPAANGDDIIVYTDKSRTEGWPSSTSCASSGIGKASEPCRALADFIAPIERLGGRIIWERLP